MVEKIVYIVVNAAPILAALFGLALLAWWVISAQVDK